MYKSAVQEIHFQWNTIDQSWLCQVELRDIDCLHACWSTGRSPGMSLVHFHVQACMFLTSGRCTPHHLIACGRVLVSTAIKFTWLSAAMRVWCSFPIYPDYTIEHESRLVEPRVPPISICLSVSSPIWTSEELVLIFCLPHIAVPYSSFARLHASHVWEQSDKNNQVGISESSRPWAETSPYQTCPEHQRQLLPINIRLSVVCHD